jgi:hypothetical protein
MKGHFAITLYLVASQRFENAMRQPRSIPQAGRFLRHLRLSQWFLDPFRTATDEIARWEPKVLP